MRGVDPRERLATVIWLRIYEIGFFVTFAALALAWSWFQRRGHAVMTLRHETDGETRQIGPVGAALIILLLSAAWPVSLPMIVTATEWREP